jgi:vancomycin resistance protein VanW
MIPREAPAEDRATPRDSGRDRRSQGAPGHTQAPDPSARALVGLLAACIIAVALVLRLGTPPPPHAVQIAGYATALEERSASQRHNARLAAEALNGQIIRPGSVFSFNHAVKPWTVDRGYVKAPVSFDGELVLAYGGGICQTSTTLYNAALLAGLPIVERHPHVFAPHYVAPGRDAAVAQYTVDLRFQNPYPWPIRIEARARDTEITVRLLAPQRPETRADIRTDVLAISPPAHRVRFVASGGAAPPRGLTNPGATGFRVITYRLLYRDGTEWRRERLSDDTYQAADRIVRVPDAEP